MEKLVEKFIGIVNNNDCLVAFSHVNEHCILPELYMELSKECVEETKKLAIEFVKWIHRSEWYQNSSIITAEQAFDKFIDEYYK